MGATFVDEIKRFEPNLKPNSWGCTWEVRTKLVTCVLSTLGIVYLQSTTLLFIAFCSLLVAVFTMGFRFTYILSKLVVFIPFLLLMSAPILFGAGLSVSGERVTFVLNLNLKVLSSALIMMILLLSQPLPKLLNGISHLRMPCSIVAILTLALHYTRIFYRTLLLYQKSLTTRLFKPSVQKNSLKVYSGVMAGLLLRSVDQSDKAYQAMVARGFKGKIPSSSPDVITTKDIIKSSLFLCFILLLAILEMW